VRSFRLLAGGQFASTIGDYCYAVALPWLVLSSHGGAILLGTVLACYGVPRTVLIPVGGVLAGEGLFIPASVAIMPSLLDGSGSQRATRYPPRRCRPGHCSARPWAGHWSPPPGVDLSLRSGRRSRCSAGL
jgi:hypothetical protein